MIEKVFYQESAPTNSELSKVVCCLVCPHNCIVPEGKHGLCQTKINIQGELYSISYGHPCSLSVDPIEKKPLFHFFPGSEI